MEALILYETHFGNTRQIAQAIAGALGEWYEVRAQPLAQPGDMVPAVDLLLIGAPTHHHGTSLTMRTFLEALPRGALKGATAVVFDTRYPGARWLTGSAAVRIARVLRSKGAQLVAAPESFFVEPDVPPRGEKRRHDRERLRAGEAERAAAWARQLVEARAPVV